MANFKPLKDYLLLLTDELVAQYAMSGPFLDVGCGKGDVSLHLAKKLWRGMAIDLSPQAIDVTKKALTDYAKYVSIECADPSHIEGKYKTIFLYDILEHIQDDDKFLENIKMKADQGAHLVISVPMFMKEWRWDDEFYGHFRRYEISGLVQLLTKNGFCVLEMWDYTFPFFWLLRRLYTRVLRKRVVVDQSKGELTQKSALQYSWDRGAVTAMFEKIFWWKPVYYIQKKFKRYLRGFECIVVAKYTG